MEILVRGPNWTGDLVMSTPGFRSLRSGFPDARITLQARAELLPLLAGSPWFDELIPVASYHRGASALWREGRRLRPRRFDLGLCIPESISSALLMRIAGVKEIVGYRRGGRGMLLHRALLPPPSWRPDRMVARELFVLGLTQAIGCPNQGTGLELYLTAEEVGRGEEILASHGISDDRPIVALAPGASYGPSKRWPVASFARVGDAARRLGAQVIAVGSPAERRLGQALRDGMRGDVADLCGELDLGTLKAVLRRSTLLVCNDAGARHVATAFGVPCVVLMGPTSLKKTPFNLDRVQVLDNPVSCSPCYLRECPIDHRCMTGLGVQRVIDAVEAELAPDRGAAA